MPELLEHAGRHYAVQYVYSLPDDAWCVELSEAVPLPAGPGEGAGRPDALTHRAGRVFVMAMVPDEDPAAEPTVRIHGDDEHVVPYAVMRWFMDHVADQVERCRVAFALAEGEPDGVG